LIDLKLFLPGSNPNFGTALKDIMNWQFDGGSITTSFIGLGYMNFGHIGIVFYSLIYGFLFNTIYELYIMSKHRSYYSTLFLMMLSMYLAGSVSSGILSVFLNSIMFLIFISIIHYIVYNIIKFIITNKK
jgi:hypothetical protein